MRRLKGVAGIVAAGLVLLLVGTASADTITIDINNPNAAIAGFPAPYAFVMITVPLGGGAATFQFQRDITGGFSYTMGAVGAVDFNTTKPVTLSGFGFGGGDGSTAFSSGGVACTPGPCPGAAGVVDGFGSFNNTVDDADGFNSSVNVVSFLATASTPFANASSVLTPNGSGFEVAAHIFVSGGTCPTVGTCTGFATNTGGGGTTTSVPEPGILLLLGSGLAGLWSLSRRRS